MSEIRQLLASAQRAEVDGNVAEALRLLRSAAQWYEARDLAPRAAQMLRQVARLEAQVAATAQKNDDFGFGDAFAGEVAGLEVAGRGPRLDDSANAWCSFCCRPASEVGALVAGPAGSFICRGCVANCASLFGSPPTLGVPLLPSQQRALARLAGHTRCALLFGPHQSGKSTLARLLGDQGWLAVDVATADDAPRVCTWLAESSANRAVLVVREVAPAPSMVLRGEHGDERLYDSSALSPFVGEACALVDAVVELETPRVDELVVFARMLLAAREVSLSGDRLDVLVQLALKSGGAGELAALITRIPAGSYR